MLNLRDPLIQLKITTSVCSVFAIGTTIYRLLVRRGRLWADDAWAFFSMLTLLVQIAAVFMHVPNPVELSMVNRVAAYYLMATSFYAIIWSARLSILFSIIRLDPSPGRRKFLLYIAAIFLVVSIILIVQLFWVCEPQPNWKEAKSPQCVLNMQVAVCQLVTDVIADSILIAAPLKLLAGLEDQSLRRRLIVIFSTCIVTTIVSLVHATYILTRGGTKVVIAAIVEDCMSLVVCNIPVVVTAIIRLRERIIETRKGVSSTRVTAIKFATRKRLPKDTVAPTQITTFGLDELSTNTTLAGKKISRASIDTSTGLQSMLKSG